MTWIIANPEWGYLVRGILDDHVKAGTMYRGIKVLGRINNLSVILPENKLDEIAITLGLNEYFRLEEIVAMCEKSGVHTQFVPDYHNIIPTKPYTEDLQGLPVVNIRYVPLSNTFNAMLKRIVDIFGALVAIILFSPVMLFSCIMIKLTSPGPLIYRQTRVGLRRSSSWAVWRMNWGDLLTFGCMIRLIRQKRCRSWDAVPGQWRWQTS